MVVRHGSNVKCAGSQGMSSFDLHEPCGHTTEDRMRTLPAVIPSLTETLSDRS